MPLKTKQNYNNGQYCTKRLWSRCIVFFNIDRVKITQQSKKYKINLTKIFLTSSLRIHTNLNASLEFKVTPFPKRMHEFLRFRLNSKLKLTWLRKMSPINYILPVRIFIQFQTSGKLNGQLGLKSIQVNVDWFVWVSICTDWI